MEEEEVIISDANYCVLDSSYVKIISRSWQR